MTLALTVALALCGAASGQVFINEVFINPPGSTDDLREYVELLGTPEMSLDGYAFAIANGTDAKYTTGPVPPLPNPIPEIDEFFSLDGLKLGKNGILVLGIAPAANYPTLLPDSNFVEWKTLWNGLGPNSAGKLQNDGSNTAFLLRNRPGVTQAKPLDPLGLIWGKGTLQDYEVVFNVFDPSDGLFKDTFGDGKLDEGQFDGFSGVRPDFHGVFTGGPEDDLEIVDEVSYESGQGWEYDVDERKVDVGSSNQPQKERRVHSLDDPQGFNPDALSRVDYRTTGPGWAPAAGATGEMPNGNNWQDTATQQWIRGETVDVAGGSRYSVAPNVDPNALQPFFTNVPLWLADGSAPDFNFAAADYVLEAGRLNRFAVPFIPGDVDRDGDCDANDIQKVRAAFGDAGIVFGNSHPSSSYGVNADPATQSRPWNLDGNGDGRTEASDLQWVLNFQGDSQGRIKGRTYDSTTPEAAGVTLGPNGATNVAITQVANASCGGSLSALRVGDAAELVVRAEVVTGKVTTAGAQNGVQQFVHDLALSNPGVLAVERVDPLFPFRTTRQDIQEPLGSGGDAGFVRLNGYAETATAGLAGPAPLYRVILRAIGPGSTSISVGVAADFAAGSPAGVKLGHTDHEGDPGASSYPAAVAVTVSTFTGAGSVTTYGVGCPGAGDFTPRMVGSGCATPGGSIDLSVDYGLGGAPPFLFIGVGEVPAIVTPTCVMQIFPLLVLTPVALPALPGSGPGAGSLALVGLGIPATAPVNVSVTLQILFQDPQTFVSGTNPVSVNIDL